MAARKDPCDRTGKGGVREAVGSYRLHMDGESIPGEKRMRFRYSGTCRVCSIELPARSEAIYEGSSKTVRCITDDSSLDESHAEVRAVEARNPGASARREYERRKARHEERTRARHPRLGGLILALSDEPQSMKAWDTGALGEERLGNPLNERASDSLRVLQIDASQGVGRTSTTSP